MKYLHVVGPVTQFQSLDQHCTISKIYWRYINNQLDLTRNLCENETFFKLVQTSRELQLTLETQPEPNL